MKRLWALVAGTIIFASPLGGTQSAENYTREHDICTSASHDGEWERAEIHCRRAWQEAEKTLGSDPTTAVLAFNYAQIVQAIDPAKAIEPLERVIAIAGTAAYTIDPHVMLSFAKAAADPSSDAKLRDLRTQLESYEKAGGTKSLLSARFWLFVAGRELDNRRYKIAKRAAGKAENHFTSAAPHAKAELAQALMIGGISRVVGIRRRDEGDLKEAAILLKSAASLFPPQTSIESFDPLLAQIIAWQGATAAAAMTEFGREEGRKYVDRSVGEWTNKHDGLRWRLNGQNKDCDLKWIKYEIGRYPRKARMDRSMGAALVGFSFGPDGKVSNAVLLAEAPSDSDFGESMLDEIRTFRLAADSDPRPECRQNFLHMEHYAIRGQIVVDN